MNWSLGFFRLWIAIACLWVGTASVIAYQEWQEELSREEAQIKMAATAPAPNKSAAVSDAGVDGWITPPANHPVAGQWQRVLIRNYIDFGLFPPFILLGVGMVIRWIARGFRGA